MGLFLGDINLLLHEFGHSDEDPSGKIRRFIWRLREIYTLSWIFHPHQPSQESYAKRSELSGGIRTPWRKKSDVVRDIGEARGDDGGPLYADTTRNQLIYAVEAVDKLRALRVEPIEIGGAIRFCRLWNEKKAIYPKIEKLIRKKRLELGLTVNDLDNLVLADRLEKEIDRMKAVIIAREELKKV